MSSTKYVCKLSDQEKLLAKVELNETDDNRYQSIEEIRQWLLDNPEIISREDDFHILKFLRSCKFDVDKTKLKIRDYYQQKTACPEWFTNRDPLLPEIQEMLDLGVFLPLTKLDGKRRLVIITRVCLHDPKRHSIDQLLKAALNIADLAVRDNEVLSLNGASVIIDVEGATLRHVLQLTPMSLSKMVNVWLKCYPMRIKSMDFVNLSNFANIILTILKTFMTKKMKSRIFVNSKEDIAVKYTRELLPEEYGGTNGNVETLKDYWKQQAEDNSKWLVEDEKYKLVK